MPRKNSLKIYIENGFYHLYNRGVEKRNIFEDEQDYKAYLYYFKKYLGKQERLAKEDKPIVKENLHGKLELLAYCLLPNHFHLLVRQEDPRGITLLMNRLGTNYVMYFNKKYNRVGPLYQGVYKAVLIENESQLLHLSRYIHLNPGTSGLAKLKEVAQYPYSSYGDYLGKRRCSWVNPNEILGFFKTARRMSLSDYLSYQSFVEDYIDDYDFGNLVMEEH